jgi:hypothetical protein
MTDEEKKPEPLTGQRRLESLYAKYEGKYQMLFVFLSLGTLVIIVIIVFAFVEIYIPTMQKKEVRAREDLEVLARAAKLYRNACGAFPESLEELAPLLQAHKAEEENAPPSKDPWKREYYYFKISDERAVFVSSGRNRKLDLHLEDLLPLSQEREQFIRARGDGFLTYSAPATYDDWIVLAGSWPSEKL